MRRKNLKAENARLRKRVTALEAQLKAREASATRPRKTKADAGQDEEE